MNLLLLGIVTGVSFVLATTAVMLALDASARTGDDSFEEIVPPQAKLRRTTLIEVASTEKNMEPAPGAQGLVTHDLCGDVSLIPR
jgi:uncharacterized protein (DUF3084 family)